MRRYVAGRSGLGLEAVASPAALHPRAIAVGTAVTGRAAFGDLDRVDQIGLLHLPGLDAQRFGLGLDLRHCHILPCHAD